MPPGLLLKTGSYCWGLL